MIVTLDTKLPLTYNEIAVCDDCNETACFTNEADALGFEQTPDGDWYCEACRTAQADADWVTIPAFAR